MEFFSNPKIHVIWETYVPLIIWFVTTLQPSASSMALSQRSTKIGPVMTKKMIYGWTAQVGYQGVMSSSEMWFDLLIKAVDSLDQHFQFTLFLYFKFYKPYKQWWLHIGYHLKIGLLEIFSYYKHRLERSIFQTFRKLHCVTKSLFFKSETLNFGYLLIFFFAELCKVWERLDNIYITHFTRVPPLIFG